MRRREFVASLGVAAIGRPLPTRAQQGERVRQIGVLSPGPKETEDSRAFFDELARLGYAEEISAFYLKNTGSIRTGSPNSLRRWFALLSI